MKKTYIIAASLFSVIAYGQVGVNTETPKTTMDITAKRDTSGTITDNNQLIGLQAPRLTRGELTANTATYALDQKGALIYITDISTGTAIGQRAQIDAEGYYYFDGAVWQKSKNINNNIYNINGTLTSNRTLTIDGKSLEFVGSDQKTLFTSNGSLQQIGLPSSTSKNASIAVIAADGNVNASVSRLDIQALPEGDTKITSSGEATGLALSTSFTNASAPITFSTTPGGNTTSEQRMIITGAGNVGIGTGSPAQKFEIHTGGTVSAPVTGFRLNDGTQATGKVITADANGVGNWQYPRVTRLVGTLGAGASVNFASYPTAAYTGSTIVLPPGKWQVSAAMIFSLGVTTCTLTATDWVWLKTTFSDSSTSATPSPDIIGSTLISCLFSGPKSSSISFKYDNVSGSVIINNTSSTNKTYYYWVHSGISDRPAPTGTCTSFQAFGGTSLSENNIIAIPLY